MLLERTQVIASTRDKFEELKVFGVVGGSANNWVLR